MLRGLPGYLAATLPLIWAMETVNPSIGAAHEPTDSVGPTSQAGGTVHDFDFLVDRWRGNTRLCAYSLSKMTLGSLG